MALGDYTIGDRGAGVSDLQSYLRDVGFNITVDGVYGPETRAAVLSFQSQRGIRADGIAGPQTLVALAQARSEGWRTSYAPAATTADPAGADSPNTAIAPKPAGSKWTGLVILLAIAVGVWWFKNSRSFADAEEEEEEEEATDDGDAEPREE